MAFALRRLVKNLRSSNDRISRLGEDDDDPVLDPELPASVKWKMYFVPGALYPAGGLPRRRLFGGRKVADVLFCLWTAPLLTFAPALVVPFIGVVGEMYPRRTVLFGWAAQAAIVGGFAWSADWTLFLLMMVVQPVVFLVLLHRCGEGPVGRLARRYYGRYVRVQDLDGPREELLERARAAIRAVTYSRVNREGLLDEIRNTVTLPRQLWEIAHTLREVSVLAAHHRDADLSDAGVRRLLAPQLQVLDLATRSAVTRIEALERYAAQVRAADRALEQWEILQRVATHSDAYQELLARTVRDELAAVEIADLTEQARTIEHALRDSVADARRAGLALLPDASDRKAG